MIQNDRQRAITTAWVERFEQSIANLRASPAPADVLEPEKREILVRSQESLLEDLQGQLSEYDELLSGKVRRFRVEALYQLGKGLIKARIAAGLTEAQLAAQLGMEEKQIDDLERFDYEQAPLALLVRIVHAIGAEIRSDVRLSAHAEKGNHPARKRAAVLAAD